MCSCHSPTCFFRPARLAFRAGSSEKAPAAPAEALDREKFSYLNEKVATVSIRNMGLRVRAGVDPCGDTRPIGSIKNKTTFTIKEAVTSQNETGEKHIWARTEDLPGFENVKGGVWVALGTVGPGRSGGEREKNVSIEGVAGWEKGDAKTKARLAEFKAECEAQLNGQRQGQQLPAENEAGTPEDEKPLPEMQEVMLEDEQQLLDALIKVLDSLPPEAKQNVSKLSLKQDDSGLWYLNGLLEAGHQFTALLSAGKQLFKLNTDKLSKEKTILTLNSARQYLAGIKPAK